MLGKNFLVDPLCKVEVFTIDWTINLLLTSEVFTNVTSQSHSSKTMDSTQHRSFNLLVTTRTILKILHSSLTVFRLWQLHLDYQILYKNTVLQNYIFKSHMFAFIHWIWGHKTLEFWTTDWLYQDFGCMILDRST